MKTTVYICNISYKNEDLVFSKIFETQVILNEKDSKDLEFIGGFNSKNNKTLVYTSKNIDLLDAFICGFRDRDRICQLKQNNSVWDFVKE